MSGQEKLRQARILLIGAGGLGSPSALYLAAAGVGTLGIVDSDRVELSNLQRQIIHDTAAIGRLKVDSARERLIAINPDLKVETITTRLTADAGDGHLVRDLIRGYDLVLDGSDNFPTRYLINDACVLEQRPLIYGSIFRFEGQVSLFAAPGGPCYRCLFADPPPPELVPSCVEGGVLGVLPGIIGTLQALEAIKWILGIGRSAAGRLLLFDALSLRLREIAVSRDPECPVCGDHPTITELIDYEVFCNASLSPTGREIQPVALQRRIIADEQLWLLDVREGWEYELVHLPGSHLIPLSQLESRLSEIPSDQEIVAICHHGLRSEVATGILERSGYRVSNLAGGVDAWAERVDPSLRRY